MAEVSQIRVKGTLYDIKDAVARLSTGAPATAASVAAMTDTSKIYVYTGSESGYTNGNWYYNNGSSWVSGGVYNSAAVETDTSLSVSGAPADAKVTGDAINNIVYVGTEASDSHTQVIVSPNSQEIELVTQTEFDSEISDLKSEITQLEAIPRSVKIALDTILHNVAFKNDNESYTDELTTFHAWATAVNLTSITAVYTQSGTVYSIDSLDSLKSDLVVTAHYDDGTDSVVSGYTLSGTLVDGTSVITVTLEDKTTSFNVTVTGVTTLYTVENHTFNGTASTGIDTGIKLHDTDKDYTILIDFTAQAQSGTYRLLTDYTTVGDHTSGLSVVKNTSSVSKMRWCDGYQDFSDFNASTTGKIRFAFQHLAESDEMTLTLKKGTNAIKSYTITSDFYACDTTMRIGTNTTSENTLKGTGSIYIYGAYLDSDHITAFLNGE